MAGIAAATLTGAGFAAGTAGAGKSGGTDYTLSINALQIIVTLFTEAELTAAGSAGFAGVAYVLQNGDVSAADFTSAAAKLAAIGLKPFAAGVPQANVTFGGAGVAGVNGTVIAYSTSF